MKKYKNIDDFFKEQVTDFHVEPSEKVWQNIETEFLKSKKSNTRNTLLWVLIPLLLIVGGIYTWTTFTNNTKQETLNSTSNTNIENIAEIDKINTKNEITSSNTKPEVSLKKINNTVANNSKTTKELKISSNNQSNSSGYISGNTFGNNNSNINNEYEEKNIENDYNINYLTPKSKYAVTNNITPQINNDFTKITVDEYIAKRKNLHFYTGASTSIAMTYYATTTDQVTWTADLIYGIKIKQFYIESGIGFQKMQEQGVFQIDYKTNDSIGYYNEVISFEVNPENPNAITYKTQTTTVYDSVEHFMLQSPNYQYDYIVIPIKFGYKFYKNNKISLSAETGILYSILTKTYVPSVNFDNENYQLIGISNNTPQRTEHNFRFHIALRANYKITNTISICVQPEFTSYINSIYEKSYNYKTRPYTMGIRFGILFDF